MRFFIYTVVFLSFLIMQVLFSTYFRISGIAPNFLLVFVISNSLIRDHKYGFFWGLTTGLVLDIMIGRALGFNALFFMYIGLLIGLLADRIYRESLLPPMFFVILSTLFYNLATYFVFFYRTSGLFTWDFFSSQIGVEMMYNAIIVLIVHNFIVYIDVFVTEKTNIY